jgi:hypothetical protein
MTIAVGIGMVSRSGTIMVFGPNKDGAQPNGPLLAIDGGRLQGTVRSLLVVFVVKLDLIVAHLVHLTWRNPSARIARAPRAQFDREVTL